MNTILYSEINISIFETNVRENFSRFKTYDAKK